MASDRLPSKLPFVRILLKPHVTWAVLVPKQAVLKLLHGQCRFPSHHPPLADHPSGFCLPHIWQPTEFTVSQVLYSGISMPECFAQFADHFEQIPFAGGLRPFHLVRLRCFHSGDFLPSVWLVV